MYHHTKMASKIHELERKIHTLQVQLENATTELLGLRTSEESRRAIKTEEEIHPKETERDDMKPREQDRLFDRDDSTSADEQNSQNGDFKPPKWPLTMDEYKRYSRQLIMPEIGLQGRSYLPWLFLL